MSNSKSNKNAIIAQLSARVKALEEKDLLVLRQIQALLLESTVANAQIASSTKLPKSQNTFGGITQQQYQPTFGSDNITPPIAQQQYQQPLGSDSITQLTAQQPQSKSPSFLNGLFSKGLFSKSNKQQQVAPPPSQSFNVSGNPVNLRMSPYLPIGSSGLDQQGQPQKKKSFFQTLFNGKPKNPPTEFGTSQQFDRPIAARGGQRGGKKIQMRTYHFLKYRKYSERAFIAERPIIAADNAYDFMKLHYDIGSKKVTFTIHDRANNKKYKYTARTLKDGTNVIKSAK